MPLRIALCDDTITDLVGLVSKIQKFCEQKKLIQSIDIFASAKDLLASTVSYDILFLDIYMGKMNGIDVAKILHKRDNTLLVFTTCSSEHALEAFSVNAVHYLVKPITSLDVEDAMNRCIARLRKSNDQMLEIRSGQSTITIPTENIIYVEVYNKISTIHTKKSSIPTYTTLDSIFKQLSAHYFLRPQRSFIVNMSYIDSFHSDRLVLANGVEIMLSRINRPELKKQYKQFLFQLARR